MQLPKQNGSKPGPLEADSPPGADNCQRGRDCDKTAGSVSLGECLQSALYARASAWPRRRDRLTSPSSHHVHNSGVMLKLDSNFTCRNC
jgi:hypothetical protein